MVGQFRMPDRIANQKKGQRRPTGKKDAGTVLLTLKTPVTKPNHCLIRHVYGATYAAPVRQGQPADAWQFNWSLVRMSPHEPTLDRRSRAAFR